jgi:hypothetical protein
VVIVSSRALCLLTLGLLGAARLPATSYCVGTSAELQAALTDAADNSQADTIRIRAGVYPAPPGGFAYLGAVDEPNDLVILGGYYNLLSDCGFFVREASRTTLVGAAPDRVLRIYHPGNAGEIRLANLTLTGGNVAGSGGGLRVETSIALVTLERIVVVGNTAGGAGGGIWANVHALHADGILVAGNLAAGGVGGAYFENHSGVTTIELATFAFNTGTPGGVQIGGSGGEEINGTIAWGNGPGVDIALSDNAWEANSNLYATRSNDVVEPLGAIHADPRFFGPGDYRLRYDSPARDAALGFSTTLTRDVLDHPRPNGAEHDIGAVEVPWIFAADHETGNLSQW